MIMVSFIRFVFWFKTCTMIPTRLPPTLFMLILQRKMAQPKLLEFIQMKPSKRK